MSSKQEKPASDDKVTDASQTASKEETNADSLPKLGLEEDDEFEDFPTEDWTEENTDLPSGNAHLWEESWDDDETNDDFSAQLKEELKKSDASK